MRYIYVYHRYGRRCEVKSDVLDNLIDEAYRDFNSGEAYSEHIIDEDGKIVLGHSQLIKLFEERV